MKLFGPIIIQAIAGQNIFDQIQQEDKWENKLPVAMFHGVNDDCGSLQIRNFINLIEENVEGTYSECIDIGGKHAKTDSLIEALDRQGEDYCKAIRANPNFNNTDFNIAGLSQGGLIARYIIQECDLGQFKVHNFLSIGGPQMGVMKQPGCLEGPLCNALAKIEEEIAYYNELQNHLAPAQYFRDRSIHQFYDQYLWHSRFLPYINNEKMHPKFDQYRARFMSLNKIELVQFQNDTVVFPKESEHFQDMDENKQIVSFYETDLYKEDWIGLKTLFEEGRVYLRVIEDADHLQFNDYVIIKQFIPFLFQDNHRKHSRHVNRHERNGTPYTQSLQLF